MYLDNWLSLSWETKSPVYIVHANPVPFVPVRTGIASSAAMPRARGVSLKTIKCEHDRQLSKDIIPAKSSESGRRNQTWIRVEYIEIICAATKWWCTIGLWPSCISYNEWIQYSDRFWSILRTNLGQGESQKGGALWPSCHWHVSVVEVGLVSASKTTLSGSRERSGGRSTSGGNFDKRPACDLI